MKTFMLLRPWADALTPMIIALAVVGIGAQIIVELVQ